MSLEGSAGSQGWKGFELPGNGGPYGVTGELRGLPEGWPSGDRNSWLQPAAGWQLPNLLEADWMKETWSHRWIEWPTWPWVFAGPLVSPSLGHTSQSPELAHSRGC